MPLIIIKYEHTYNYICVCIYVHLMSTFKILTISIITYFCDFNCFKLQYKLFFPISRILRDYVMYNYGSIMKPIAKASRGYFPLKYRFYLFRIEFQIRSTKRTRPFRKIDHETKHCLSYGFDTRFR